MAHPVAVSFSLLFNLVLLVRSSVVSVNSESLVPAPAFRWHDFQVHTVIKVYVSSELRKIAVFLTSEDK